MQNYEDIIHDKEVWATFGNTLKYVLCTVPVGLFLSILIAALLNSKIKGTSIYRTLYFLPSVTMAAAVAMVWKWIYNEKMGILNSVIRGLGGKGHGWLTDQMCIRDRLYSCCGRLQDLCAWHFCRWRLPHQRSAPAYHCLGGRSSRSAGGLQVYRRDG